MNILLAITGSVAATITDKTVKALQKHGEVRLVMTDSAALFDQESPEFYNKIEWYEDYEEWEEWNENENVLHIDLVKWADVLVVAPLSANTLAKFANGICDNLATCIFRAWPNLNYQHVPPDLITSGVKPIVIAPAMNTVMWEDPITRKHIESLWNRKNTSMVHPVIKTLACGDHGVGAMAEIEDIVKTVEKVTK
jgi:phosphopantothenoylcysteine synthetase/decarboxylase